MSDSVSEIFRCILLKMCTPCGYQNSLSWAGFGVAFCVLCFNSPHAVLGGTFCASLEEDNPETPNKHIRSEALETPQCHFLTSITLSSKHQWKIPSGRMRTWAEALPRSHPEDVILCHWVPIAVILPSNQFAGDSLMTWWLRWVFTRSWFLSL